MAYIVKLHDNPRPLVSGGTYAADTTGTTVLPLITGGVEALYNVRTYPHAAMTEEEALLAAEQSPTIPATYDRYYVRTLKVEERVNEWWYRIRAKWSTPGNAGSGNTTIRRTFASADTTLRIYQALSETAYPSGAPSAGAQIQVANDGEVKGCDKAHSYLTMTEVHSKPSTTMTDTYIRNLAGFVAEHYVNSDAFRMFQPGECQIASIQIGEAAGGYFPVTFVFNCGKNLTSETIPGTSITISKTAFQYLWTRTIRMQSAMKFWTETPQYAYVNTIYPSTAFATIVDA